MKRKETKAEFMEFEKSYPFACNICGKLFEFPFEQAACEQSHKSEDPARLKRAERQVLLLLAMAAPEHATQASEHAAEILEVLRK